MDVRGTNFTVFSPAALIFGDVFTKPARTIGAKVEGIAPR